MQPCIYYYIMYWSFQNQYRHVKEYQLLVISVPQRLGKGIKSSTQSQSGFLQSGCMLIEVMRDEWLVNVLVLLSLSGCKLVVKVVPHQW